MPSLSVKRPHWYDYRITSFGNYMPTYWRRDIPRSGAAGGKTDGGHIIMYIAGAIGLFVGAGLLVSFL